MFYEARDGVVRPVVVPVSRLRNIVQISDNGIYIFLHLQRRYLMLLRPHRVNFPSQLSGERIRIKILITQIIACTSWEKDLALVSQ